MKTVTRWLLILLVAAAVAGCATTDDEIGDEEMREMDEAAERAAAEREAERARREAEEAEAAGAAGAAGFEGDALEDPDSPLSERVIYFEFDSSNIDAEGIELLEAHADYLAENPQRRVLVEGHTDERGSREYNLALGERRAQAVARVLQLNGVDDDQVETLSYGEEQPAANGSNEEAWAQNRRAELVYER
ncbi:peptidoglycan-associated lipoprotein Pal [Sediminicurvatus halobius]|uniref:Peptidoglycan-associated lipoprotein n=1 Tax=Sediminicurvatus halobius TaxID=2182432 RepID=A0A2U2MWC0_9GAMM|nr:peptidoglycan-associated lipoprotein Pal [Spiribacter halobius]PWG61153.1 peptidoglycan-associated lipoprotein Pal [Spiribacter halobius]UEX78635.1 peptidoglycan-associated lipoprotein Pal [Spiribacter halobius]